MPTNLNPLKRPISAVDLEVKINQMVVKTNNRIKFNLLYDKNKSTKIKIEQIKRN